MKPTLIITGVVAVLLLLGLAAGVGDVSSSSSSSSSYSSSSSNSSDSYSSYSSSDEYGGEDPQSLELNWLPALTVLSGALAIGAVFVPTMPRNRQLLLGGVGLLAGIYGIWVWEQDTGHYSFPAIVTIAPLLIVGWAGYGWHQNFQRGEGARGSLDDTDNTGPDLVFPVAIRAGSRGSVGLDLDVEASPETVRDAVGRALANRGNYFTTDGCAYSVLRHQPDGLDCAILSGFRGLQHCTFSVRLSGTRLSVRLLEYQTVNEKILFVIPMGPATIPGYGSYRHFLQALTREIRRIDRGAGARVVQT
ncbi:hypothetical protein [Actinomycetospora sp. CA-053990]|uniref:hypothetical protein n=1 Tax=Actinomycetospora sp. CA-053990 TaxID=3239891 RepID=UPI003D90A6D8